MAQPRPNQGQLDVWSVKERLALACSVLRSGDQNWVSVSRAIKPYGESNRPPEWFSQKNCAMQYAHLLDKAETPKRKRGERGEIETPGIQIIRKLSIERMEELKKKVIEQQQKYKKLKKDIESVKSGQLDDRLSEIWSQMLLEREMADKAKEVGRKPVDDSEASKPRKGTVASRIQEQESAATEIEDSNQGSLTESVDIGGVLTPDESQIPTQTPLKTDLPVPSGADKQKSVSSNLLSSMLISTRYTVPELHKVKTEAELKQNQAQLAAAEAASQAAVTPVAMETVVKTPDTTLSTGSLESVTTPSSVAPTLTKLLVKTGKLTDPSSQQTILDVANITPTPIIQTEVKNEENVTKNEEAEREEEIDDATTEDDEDTRDSTIDVGRVDAATPVQKLDYNPEDSRESSEVQAGTFISVDDEISIKGDEALSPASSVSSKLSECDISIKNPRRNRRGRPSKAGRRYTKKSRKSQQDEDKKETISSRLSDGETTEDEVGESDDTILTGQQNMLASGNLSESIPNSPLSHCSDTEDEKAHKNWKKSIMLVWRSAANHKYANVFLHPVTEDIAPGYSSIVSRPMNLMTIKKNIENGVIRTTSEFQRDMMLMFTNAIMYNSSNHNVYRMAVEMYDDVLQHIEQYVSTQLMVQSTDTKHLRTSRRAENSDKEDDTKRRRTSSEAHVHSEGGKAKKRKM